MWHPHLKKKWLNSYDFEIIEAKKYYSPSTFLQLKENKFLSPNIGNNCKCAFTPVTQNAKVPLLNNRIKTDKNNEVGMKPNIDNSNNNFQNQIDFFKVLTQQIEKETQKHNEMKEASFLQVKDQKLMGNSEAIMSNNSSRMKSENLSAITNNSKLDVTKLQNLLSTVNNSNLLKTLTQSLQPLVDEKSNKLQADIHQESTLQPQVVDEKPNKIETNIHQEPILLPMVNEGSTLLNSVTQQETNQKRQIPPTPFNQFAAKGYLNNNVSTLSGYNDNITPKLNPQISNPFMSSMFNPFNYPNNQNPQTPLINPEMINYYNSVMMNNLQTMLLMQSQMPYPFMNINQMAPSPVLSNFYNPYIPNNK
jgi:hypothetical protein